MTNSHIGETYEEHAQCLAEKYEADQFAEIDRLHAEVAVLHAERNHWRTARGIVRTSEDVATLFVELARTWKRETAFLTSPEQVYLNHAYQRIIGLGPRALPHILEDLQRSGSHWFWALAAIVGEDQAEGANSVQQAAGAWLSWGRAVGLIDAAE